jgi:hypothetical protein
MPDATFCSRRRHFVVGSSQNESPACAAEAEKLIGDKNDIIGNSAVNRSRQISGSNPLRA